MDERLCVCPAFAIYRFEFCVFVRAATFEIFLFMLSTIVMLKSTVTNFARFIYFISKKSRYSRSCLLSQRIILNLIYTKSLAQLNKKRLLENMREFLCLIRNTFSMDFMQILAWSNQKTLRYLYTFSWANCVMVASEIRNTN